MPALHQISRWAEQHLPEDGQPEPAPTLTMVRLDLITIVVDDYDRAIAFFTDALGFDLGGEELDDVGFGQPAP